MSMTSTALRLFLGLIVALGSVVSVRAEDQSPDPSLTNSLGMKFVWIPPGVFMMGSPEDETGRMKDETPHQVTLTKGFYMGIYTITQEDWLAVMGTNPSKFQGEKRLPVEQVSWNDCHAFIAKLKEKDSDKKRYRLPTEAEWEYACRAGTTTPYYFGKSISVDQANYNGGYVYGDGKQGVYREKTLPVGSFAANPWGLYDMCGNVAQWCDDLYVENLPKGPVTDPKGMTGGSKALRGGSWIDCPKECRSAFRGGSEPARKHSLVGFRLCFNVEEK